MKTVILCFVKGKFFSKTTIDLVSGRMAIKELSTTLYLSSAGVEYIIGGIQ